MCIKKAGWATAYGEHPSVEPALEHAAEDFKAGGRSYGEVYGKLHPHYWTGSATPSSPLDEWILGGSTFDAWEDGDQLVVELKGYDDDINPVIYTARGASLGDAFAEALALVS